MDMLVNNKYVYICVCAQLYVCVDLCMCMDMNVQAFPYIHAYYGFVLYEHVQSSEDTTGVKLHYINYIYYFYYYCCCN